MSAKTIVKRRCKLLNSSESFEEKVDIQLFDQIINCFSNFSLLVNKLLKAT